MGYIETLPTFSDLGYQDTTAEIERHRRSAGVRNRAFLTSLWKTYPEKKPAKFERTATGPAYVFDIGPDVPKRNEPEALIAERRRQAAEKFKAIQVGLPMSRAIIEAVAMWFDLRPADLIGRRRASHIVTARFVAMKLLHDQRNSDGDRKFSYPHIGQFFGGRDHSTVIHAMTTFYDRARAYPEMLEAYEDMKGGE